MIKEKCNARNINIDLVKTIAVFSVICVHFFKNINFYKVDIIGERLSLMVGIRTLFMICVPLFIMVTGYLMINKEPSKKYYKGITKTLCIYILASIVCLLYKKFYLNQDITFLSGILSILTFKGNYAWYMEMYFGLFLLIPFLNTMFKNLKNDKHQLYLIATTIIITMLPVFLNRFDLTTPGWFLNPQISNNYTIIAPTYYNAFYPIVYYFIGAYIKLNSKPDKEKFKKHLLYFLIAVVTFSAINIWRSYGTRFDKNIVNFNSYQSLIMSIFAFIMLLNINLKKLPNTIKFLICKISDLSLCIYLTSYIFDNYFYKAINLNIDNAALKFNHFIPGVLKVFICAIILSQLIMWIYKILYKLINKLITYISVKTTKGVN